MDIVRCSLAPVSYTHLDVYKRQEIVHAADGSIAALLGASPGASVVVDIMLDMLSRCFPQYQEEWLPKIKEMIPSYGIKLADHPDMFQEVQASTAQTLGLVH